jgi:alkaline phosphatase D
VAVEFVVTSITSPGFPFNVGSGIIQSSNQHVKYIDLTQHGYLILDLTEEAAQSDWYYISTKTDSVFTTAYGAGWKTNDGDNFLSQATVATEGTGYPPLAPAFVSDPVSVATIKESPDGIIVSAYPNPFDDDFTVQLNAFRAQRVSCSLTDMLGRTVLQHDLGVLPAGLHYIDVNAPEVMSGMYLLSVTIGDERMTRSMIKR